MIHFAGTRGRSARLLAALPVLGLGLLTFAGCGRGLNTIYGQTGGVGLPSVNGTRVLADMFSDRGHKVESRYELSPRLSAADAIVWFPDDFEPPPEEAREWLDNWLFEAPNRTLVFVGRDFDAAPSYWKKVAAIVPPAERERVLDQVSEATAEFRAERRHKSKSSSNDKSSSNEWFDLSRKREDREIHSLTGPWSHGIDAARCEIELHGRLTPGDSAESLLKSGDEVLVSRVQFAEWPGSQLVIVENGSFLLNLPLINHQHRKLAGRLIDLLGEPGRRVVFLGSGRGGPKIRDKDSSPDSNALAVLGVWPLSGVLLHLSVLGLIFAFARWPIFGRPVVPPPPPTSDFGKHVAAVGQLLARTRDRQFAADRLEAWQAGQHGRRSVDSGGDKPAGLAPQAREG